MAAVHVALCDASHIDGGIGRADVEQPDEETGILGLAEELQLLGGREDCLENEVAALLQTVVTLVRGFLGSLQHSLGRVPVAEDFLRDVVGINVQAVSRPLVFKQLGGSCRLTRSVGTSDDAECGSSCCHIAMLRFHSFISSATVWSLLRFSASAFAFDSRAAWATFSIRA